MDKEIKKVEDLAGKLEGLLPDLHKLNFSSHGETLKNGLLGLASLLRKAQQKQEEKDRACRTFDFTLDEKALDVDLEDRKAEGYYKLDVVEDFQGILADRLGWQPKTNKDRKERQRQGA